MTLEETLNDLLVKLFKDILEIEAHSRKQWMPCVRKDMLSGNGVRGINE